MIFSQSMLLTLLNSSERKYKGYTLLLQLVPRVKEMLEDPTVDTDTFNHFIAQV